MIISIFNCSGGKVSDAEMQKAIRAINIQIERDFEPYWSFGATLRLEGHTRQSNPRKRPYNASDMRGDAVLYLWDHVPKDYEGMHDRDFRGVPFGVVGLDLSESLDENWTVTLSHEALELVGDPESNLLVQGPSPRNPARDVFHWFEMCDAVQAQSYELGGIYVADFVLPLYFTRTREKGSRNNFLGIVEKDSPVLKSFGVLPGGYVGYFNPATRENATYELPKDRLALKRQQIKSEFRIGRRVQRMRRGKF